MGKSSLKQQPDEAELEGSDDLYEPSTDEELEAILDSQEPLSEELLSQLAGGDPGALKQLGTEIEEYAKLRAQRDELAAATKTANKRLEAQTLRVYDFLEAAGLKSANHRLGRVTRKITPYAKVVSDQALREDLDNRGILSRFRISGWRKGELNKLVKELRKAGEELTGVTVWDKRGITWTPTKGAVKAQEVEQED